MDKAYSEKELNALEKSMKDLGFDQEKIDEAITKAKGDTDDIEKAKEKDLEGKDKNLEKAEDKPDEEGKTEEGKIEDIDLKKSMEEVTKSISDVTKSIGAFNKAVASFQDLSGKLPGITAPTTTTLGKSLDTDIDKSVDDEDKPDEGKEEPAEGEEKSDKGEEKPVIDKSVNEDISKSFGGNEIMKSFGDMLDSRLKERDTSLEKSLSDINEKYDKIEKSFDQFMDSPSSKQKAVTHNYKPIEKSIKTNTDGKRIVRLGNKDAVLAEMESAFNKAEGDDKLRIAKAIPGYEISKSIDNDAFGIVSSMNDVEFEA